MLKTVHIIENTLDPLDTSIYQVENLLEFLTTKYSVWPDTARIYHELVSISNDVTPSDESGIEKLAQLEGNFYCVIYPADPITILYAVVAVAVVAAVLLRPQVPTVSERNTQSTSPNNELSSRVNKARPNGRIPDIFGQVRSTPDLISLPYTTYIGNQEVENCVMCVGRGEYEIYDTYDGETPWTDVAGSTVEYYKPNVDINYSQPYYRLGTPINENVWNVARSNSVNGQVMRPPNSASIVGNNDIYFETPNRIIINSGRKFTDSFVAGDTLILSGGNVFNNVKRFNATYQVISENKLRVNLPIDASLGPGLNFNILNGVVQQYENVRGEGEDYVVLKESFVLNGLYKIQNLEVFPNYADITLENPVAVNVQWKYFDINTQSRETDMTVEVSQASNLYNLNGTYTILSVADDVITLNNPGAVNPQWNNVPAAANSPSSPTLETAGFKVIGQFLVENVNGGTLANNFIAANGLYKDNGEAQYSADVDIRVEYRRIMPDGSLGPWTGDNVILRGSSVNRETRASTLRVSTPFAGDCYVRAYRVNPSDVGFDGNVVDEVKWKDLFKLSDIPNANFGDVTLIKSQSFATAGALALKERKLNTLVCRKIKEYLGNGQFSLDLRPIPYASHIIFHMAMDPKIGNRDVSELDLDNIYGTCDLAPRQYFGTDKAIKFEYTFDKENLSFEESIQMVANAVFCLAYRQGNLIRLSFERETEDSTLLFNHRNKLPGTETRTVTFGNQNDNDGVELEYVSPEDDAIETYYLPTNRTAVNPKKITTVGIRNFTQAYFTAWRAWNKIQFQNINIEFDATHEADLTIPTDRILVADNTRPNTQDGEIVRQEGLTVYTSQKLEFADNKSYVAFIQLSDESVQSIPVLKGPTAASMVLTQAPYLPLAVERDFYARTTYILVANDDVRQRAFLVTEKITQDKKTSKIRGANYDARFYQHDKDFINGII